MTTNIQNVLNEIVKKFESGDIPEATAYSTFPIPDIPSTEWSFLNRTLMFLAGTTDARGFRQWQAVGRRVKKGAKAFYILVPKIFKRKEDEPSEKEDEDLIVGFLARPVFRLEDTDGKPLEYVQPELPELPLLAKAREWGISVKAIPGNKRYYGYFSAANKEIALASKEESVFFHEIAHCAHDRIMKALNPQGSGKQCPEWQKEVVAELSAAALCRIVGKTSKFLGNSYKYIRYYADQAKITPAKACLEVLREVEQVLGLILAPTSGADENNVTSVKAIMLEMGDAQAPTAQASS